ncbi:PKD domain-containing protein [Daejeonella lutea]|uniref:PKD domain-containing protein n=1 Tax=Daejeonella lutea TaxID=572036 RepID=UPI00111727BC|nr:PKD domain-containing protein [Daejeonella lutea]
MSNKGTDFWLAYGNHVRGYTPVIGQEMIVYITSDVNTSGILSVGGTNIPFTVTANAITNVNVPQAAYLGNSEGKITNKGIHITSLKPVVVYSHIYDTSVSGATLVLPTNTLGKEYYSINYQQVSNDDNSFSFFFVVAIEDNTQITIKPSVNTLGGLQAGVTSAPISLNKGEVYQVFGTKTSSSNPFRGTDLTGSVIKSISTSNEICKKIAVFSGSGKISIGCLANNAPNGQAGSADNLFQQVYPTATWGNSFVTVPSKNRNYDIYRVFKSDPSAVVKVNGAIIQSTDFTNGLYYDFPSQVVNYVESDKPIQVIQYAVTQGKSINCAPIAGDVGDPEMIFLNPLSQTLSKITMYSTPLFQILRHYINVVIPTSGVSSFKVDGVSKSALFLPVASAPGFSYAQLDMNAGTHNLQADIGFNAIAYGFGSAESYGYAAGASLESAGLQARSASTKQVKTVGCINEGYNFDVTLPYEPTKLTLDLDNGDPAVQVPIKLTKTEVINGVTNYTYEVINDVKFTTARRYSIKLIVEKSTTDGCGSADEVNLDLDMQNVPQSSFTSDIQQSCISSPITFTDGTVSNGTTIVKWYWDFGDGIKEIKTTGEPVQHSYAAAGDYKVSLVTETDGGCQSSPITPLAIHINRTPDALFSVPALKCETQAFQFTDKSVANEGSITKWNWDFGDGNTSTEQNPVHSFSKAGTYVVKLIVQTDKGCLSNESTQNVVVNAIPEVAFEVPDFCLADGAAQFTNKTTIADGTGSQLTYLWDFGDSQANAQRPNTSTLKDASHRYTKAGRYTVRLTVKSANGCEVTITKMFVVNGSVPKADFNIKNPGACSNGLVEFEDKVVVDLDEEVTKIEWIYDFANNPTVKEIDDEPAIRAAPTRVYSHKYPTFTSPASMTYQVRILAYTGGTCVSIITKSVTVLAVPLAEFDLPPACLTNGTAEFKNKSSIAGTGLTLSYAWDFGDTLSTPQNPNISSETDPAHKYSKAGDYIVKLVVTSSSGCSTTIIKTLTVAGSVPDAAFTVLTPDKLCSDAPVIFEDHTKIAFGEVTKIEWYYDYGNNPSLKFTDDNPAKRTDSPRQYTHSYPMFFSPATKTVIVRMLAFSGATCVDEELVSVTLHAVPRVQFDPIPDICSDSQPITLTQAKEIHGVLSGKGTYTGKGITATGQFSQAIAGLGTHTITYTFVADNGCVDSKTQTITVNPIPTASLGPPLFVLDGADIKLPAVVTGNIISYKWSPALYLDNDDILVPVAKPTDDITYTLTVTTDKGCIATASVFVKVLKMPEVPNSFTPNGDGVNDTWNVKHLEFYPGATVDIFNRYGDRLFKIENYLKPWDGTFNSSELPVGTYYYIINPKNGRKVVSGSVSIIR